MNKTPETKEIWTVRGLLAASILAGFGGIAAFLVLFLPDYNIYWFMLSPIILTFYELPAIYLFWLYRKKKQSISERNSESEEKTKHEK